MIAIRAQHCLDLGIVTALTAGILLMQPAPPAPSAPAIRETTHCTGKPVVKREEPVCDPARVTNVVVRGQFTSKEVDSFAISFSGARGRYTAMTDKRGYFEVRIPREDFAGDVCDLPLRDRNFSDAQMTLQYEVDVERE